MPGKQARLQDTGIRMEVILKGVTGQWEMESEQGTRLQCSM